MTLFAYIGPGPGLAMLGALLGLVFTILAAVGAVLLWPIRKLMGKTDEDDESEQCDKGAGDQDAEQILDEDHDAGSEADTEPGRSD